MCFCGDPCKVAKSDEHDTPLHRYVILSSGSTLGSILKIRRMMEYMLRWDAERKEMLEKRLREEAAEKEHKEEEERRRVAANREEREKKLEHARRAKAAIEEDPDALRKGKWPRCTQ
uniref:Uncharacterized protein n=1 Tax=Setaria viridis TaxID=4556 RepID=A0A4U6VUD9_SETVI|nr:hypothetical protein SEVIR_2G180000v2 [Setaria viridis]